MSMNILATESAEVFFDRIIEINSKKSNLKEKISEIRTLLGNLFKELTKDESQVFSSIHARTLFIFDKYQVPKTVAEEVNGLRIFANKVVYGHIPEVDERDYIASIKAISQNINYFSNFGIPAELKLVFQDYQDISISKKSITPGEVIPFIKAVVISTGDIKKSSNNQNYCTLFCKSDDETGTFNATLWDIPATRKSNAPDAVTYEAIPIGKKLSEIGNLAWKYATVNFFNLKKVENTENLYTSTPETQVVLEPDYLVDASKIAECFPSNNSNPLLYLLALFVPSDTTDAIIKGTLVNDFLDELIMEPEPDLFEICNNSIKEKALTAVSLGLGDREMQELKDDIMLNHFENLQQISNELKNKDSDVQVEPTFLSEKYGLQGRLDALIEYQKDPFRKDVFELKSGKAPGYATWESHKMQVVCYNLLLNSVFSEKRTGTSSIFYSKAIKDNLRNVAHFPQLEQDVLMLRNNIVSMSYKIAQQDYSALSKLTLDEFGARPKFTDTALIDFHETLESASELEKKYFKIFVSFIFRELRTAKIGSDEGFGASSGFASLWNDSREDKSAGYGIIYDLCLEKFDKDNSVIIFKRHDESVSSFREGDIAIIYPQSENQTNPLKHQLLKGIITKIEDDILKISLRNKYINENYLKKYKKWAIEPDMFESGFNSLFQSLFNFLKAGKRIKNILLGIEQPISVSKTIEINDKINNKNLTENQEENLKKAILAKDYFLLQGPPGTGKTSLMLINLVEYIFNNSNENIAVLAFTNRAVDEISDKLTKNNFPFIRLGGANRKENYIFSNAIKDKNLGEISQLLKDNRIFVSTVSSFLTNQRDLSRFKEFGTVIIDEATQLLEPHLIGLLPAFKKFVLIGDQNQLPAVVTQKEKNCIVNEFELNSLNIVDLSQSLFERLFARCKTKNWSNAYGTLTNHYRIHQNIADLINPFYDNNLMPATKEQKSSSQKFSYQSEDKIEKLLSSSRVLFIPSRREKGSKRNTDEAIKTSAILNTIKRVYDKDFNRDTVGVITPFRAQISNIKKHIIDKEILDKVTIDTVERFQGSERDIIILSMAISHPGQLKMIQSLTFDKKIDRKLNVAISRAKKQLIILGCSHALAGSFHYRNLIEMIKQKEGYIDYQKSDEIFSVIS